MNVKTKAALREWLPPIILKLLKPKAHYGFHGNFSSWKIASDLSSGYDENTILDKVRSASLKVKNGEAVFERDSVIFDHADYSFPILAGILHCALKYSEHFSILDFGGSLGSSYYQYRHFLKNHKALRWSVVEQPHFVKCGKQFFEDEVLKFYGSIDDCINHESPQLILLSSVIQYLENPYSFLKELIQLDIANILVDRTAFTRFGGCRLTIQKVAPSIYPASYPAWFLDLETFLKIFSQKYNLVFDFESSDEANIASSFKGFYFRKK
jgi:putative methyltransferase (TIGR04325 family)